MRVPSYRKHSSGQARVTINGKDHLLGPYGSAESREAYGRLIAEYNASGKKHCFGQPVESLKMEDVLLAFLRHARTYYQGSGEHYQYKLTARPITDLYGNHPAAKFGVVEFKAVRAWWLEDRTRSRQYVNKQMQRTLRIVKWAVGEGLMPPEVYTALECVDSLKKGRCEAREAKRVTCVDQSLVDATLPHLTPVVADMVRFQQLTGCRPGEVCKLKPSMVNRSGEVWTIRLDEHKTAHRDKIRTIYVGPQAQAVLKPYLLRAADAYCFSPTESEKQRRQARHEARVTPITHGNRPGTNVARRPRVKPGECYNARSYFNSIRYACKRAKLQHWAPNQLRHSAATTIRREFGIDAASVILGHSGLEVTQVYAEADRQKAIEVARQIG
jgi:integrase